MTRATICALLLISTFACGEDRPKVPTKPPGDTEGGVEEDGSRPIPDAGKDSDGGSSEAGTTDLLAPVVSFEGLMPATDPVDDTVITTANLTVHCKASKSEVRGAVAVDRATVKITVLGSGDEPKTITTTVNAMANDIYEASVDLSALPNGPITLRCEARDTATTPRSTVKTLTTLLDLGPEIEFFEPKEMSTHTLKTPVAVQFQVKSSSLGDDDTEAEVKSVKLAISGVETSIEESTMTAGLYTTSIDFDDRALYPVPPTSAEFRVTATNGRTPDGAVRVKRTSIAIDGEGPKITVNKPSNGQIVGGKVALEIEVSDVSGLKPGSLVANVNNGLLIIKDWNGTGPTYTQTFNTGEFSTSLTQLTINITAADGVDNQTTVALQLRLDNRPPVISLDPKLVFETKKSGEDTACSLLFDPVGDDAADDLETVNPKGPKRFRALIEDRTNEAPGAITYLSGVATDSVQLLAQVDTSIPFLTNTDSDPECDDIPYDANAPKHPVALDLKPVNVGGTAWYGDLGEPPPSGCISAKEKHPDTICKYSEMWRVVFARSQGKPPAVFAIMPSNDGGSGECNGTSWDLRSITQKEGWICVAAKVKDMIGNIGVSAPLRICLDDGDDNNGKPACDIAQAPTCTEKCTISAAQRFKDHEYWVND